MTIDVQSVIFFHYLIIWIKADNIEILQMRVKASLNLKFSICQPQVQGQEEALKVQPFFLLQILKAILCNF